jgi:predicted RNase H-like HicB family nuclease
MEIPVAIHKDEISVYGVIVPDVPGCFSWGDSIEDAMQNTREAIYSHVQAMLAEGGRLRFASPVLRTWLRPTAMSALFGRWCKSMLEPRPERINVSIPRFLLSRIDAYAASRHETRSGFLTRAALTVIDAESKTPAPA